MDDETSRLVERWIIAFLETPSLPDAELMARILAEHDAELAARQTHSPKAEEAGTKGCRPD